MEQNDCTDEQKRIKEVNTGIYVVDNEELFKAVEKIKKNKNKSKIFR